MSTDTVNEKRLGRKPILTPQQKQLVLNFIHEFRHLRRKSPTYNEIARGIGYSNSSDGTVHTLIKQLIAEGWLENSPRESRSIFPLRPETDTYAEITDLKLKKIAKQQKGLKILRRL
jgi:SOS-response transcriptional repressor LexA